jgi:tetratricopeptide (TPR) repeat protein
LEGYVHAFVVALGLALAPCGAVLADPASDCIQEKDQDLSIRGCTLIIEGRTRGNKIVIYNIRGLAYYGKGEYDLAIADYDEAIRLNPNYASAYNNRAWALLKARRPEDAKADADKAVALAPTPENLDTRGHILLALGNASGALSDFNAALYGSADSISSLWGRGEAYEAQGFPAQAIIDFRKAVELEAADAEDRDAQEKARARLAVLQATH